MTNVGPSIITNNKFEEIYNEDEDHVVRQGQITNRGKQIDNLVKDLERESAPT